MSARIMPEKFLVAFSFAGEQRGLVRQVAEVAENRLGYGTVFFDEWFEHYIAGDSADLTLQSIYVDRCVLAVVCVSGRYGGKPWTLAEHAAIRERVMKARASGEERERLSVLPIRVADGEVSGVLFNTIVPDVRSRAPADTAELIINRLQLVMLPPAKNVTNTPTMTAGPPTPLVAEHSKTKEKPLFGDGRLVSSEVNLPVHSRQRQHRNASDQQLAIAFASLAPNPYLSTVLRSLNGHLLGKPSRRDDLDTLSRVVESTFSCGLNTAKLILQQLILQKYLAGASGLRYELTAKALTVLNSQPN